MNDLHAEDEVLRERLQALREEPASIEFQSQLPRRKVDADPPQPASRWARVRRWLRRGAPWLWPVSVIALCVAVFFLLSTMREAKRSAAEAPGQNSGRAQQSPPPR